MVACLSRGFRRRGRDGGGTAFRASLIALSASLLATSCAHYVARPISPDSTLDAFEARRLDSGNLEHYLRERLGVNRWPPGSWDVVSLTLVAFFYSPELDVARSRWGVASAGIGSAGERPNPTLSVSEGYNASSVGITPWIPEAVLDIPIETAGKRGLRISGARHLSDAARLDVLSVAWHVHSRVRRAFLDLFVSQRTAALLAWERDLQEESVHILEARLAAGDVSANEVTQARIALDRVRLAVLDAARQSEGARLRLTDSLGVPRNALDGTELSFEGLEHVGLALPSDEARRRALISRSDILAALAEYEAAQAALQLEIARQYPDLDIGAGYQRDQTDGKWTLTLSLPLPILSRNRGPIAEAEARRAEAAARFAAVQSAVISELDAAQAACRAAADRMAATAELVSRLQRRLTSVRSAYRLGELPRLELLGAEVELAEGERAQIDALGAAHQAAGELEDAMQSPLGWEESVLAPPHGTTGEEEPKDG